MSDKLIFHELSYQRQAQHWVDDGAKLGRLDVHKSWFREDTIDFWRHNRMYEAVFHCLSDSRALKWLTIGDGRYGLDAIRMTRRGFVDVTASDLTDHLLKVSCAAGLLEKISAENAEKLSFADRTFDYILCKESFHHFPRPMLALYEMLRVARKGVLFIEPQDSYIDLPTVGGEHNASYEADGNYVYSMSRRELEKVALGINLPAIAFKNVFDIFRPGLENELAAESNPAFLAFQREVFDIESRCSLREVKYNTLLAVVFIELPTAVEESQFIQRGWTFKKLERNPYI